MGFGVIRADVGTSAAARYQLQFGQDVINLALVGIFNFLNNIGLQLSANVFQISQQRQALFVMCNFMKRSLSQLITFLLLAASSNSQKIKFEKLKPFIIPGYSILDTASGDFNNDRNQDVILILKNNKEEDSTEMARPLLILFGKFGGSLKLFERNDSVVFCKGCGGMFGDPYDGIKTKGQYFSIQHYGGARYKWTEIITFRYSEKLRDFVLHKDAGVVVDGLNPDSSDVQELQYHKSDVGKIRFKDYSYHKEE